jgi:hypothetical protein
VRPLGITIDIHCPCQCNTPATHHAAPAVVAAQPVLVPSLPTLPLTALTCSMQCRHQRSRKNNKASRCQFEQERFYNALNQQLLA